MHQTVEQEQEASESSGYLSLTWGRLSRLARHRKNGQSIHQAQMDMNRKKNNTNPVSGCPLAPYEEENTC